MKIDLHPRLLKRIGKFSAADRRQISEALRSLRDGFGKPHLHAGLGIRRLRKDLFECRAGLRLRIAFLAERGALTVYDAMTHDQIKVWLRTF